MLDVNQKIAEIRKQPEYIRMRWVYGAVGVSMAFVLLVWMLSVKINFSSPQRDDESIDAVGDVLRGGVDTLTEQAHEQPSINDLLNNSGATPPEGQ